MTRVVPAGPELRARIGPSAADGRPRRGRDAGEAVIARSGLEVGRTSPAPYSSLLVGAILSDGMKKGQLVMIVRGACDFPYASVSLTPSQS